MRLNTTVKFISITLLSTLLFACNSGGGSASPYLTFQVIGTTNSPSASIKDLGSYFAYFQNSGFENNLQNLISTTGSQTQIQLTGADSMSVVVANQTFEFPVVSIAHNTNRYATSSVSSNPNNNNYLVNLDYNNVAYTGAFTVPQSFYTSVSGYNLKSAVCTQNSNGVLQYCTITTNKPISIANANYSFNYQQSSNDATSTTDATSNTECMAKNLTHIKDNQYRASFASCNIKNLSSNDQIFLLFVYTENITSKPSGINMQGVYIAFPYGDVVPTFN